MNSIRRYIYFSFNLNLMKFRVKVSEMGERLLIYLPKGYYKEFKPLKGKFVDVEVKEA